MSDHRILDATDVLCPLPLLKLKLALRDMVEGETIELRVSDRTSTQDIPAYCRISGQTLLSSSEHGGVFIFLVKKAAS